MQVGGGGHQRGAASGMVVMAAEAEPSLVAQAEGCLHQAVEIARRQQAKFLELRAVMSMSRLWQRQDKEKEARPQLSEIYGWFTEGWDTADLHEAKGLLEELNPPSRAGVHV